MSRTLTAYFFLAILSSIVSLSTRKLLPHEKLVKSMKYHKMDENVIFAVIEAAEQSIRRRNICSPPMFFNPTDSNAILESFKDIVDVKVSCFGGYDQAERTRTFFCNSDPYMLEVFYFAIIHIKQIKFNIFFFHFCVVSNWKKV